VAAMHPAVPIVLSEVCVVSYLSRCQRSYARHACRIR
jgi:hypothetical protein